MAISKCAISIIVTVYDNEDTITHCINSILAQKFTNFELIIVNNGSSTGLTALCEAYREKDSRVLVIHIDHGVKGIAWNKGIDEATGRYVLLMEGNGYLEEDVLCKLYELLAKNLDVIFLPAVNYVPGEDGSVTKDLVMELDSSIVMDFEQDNVEDKRFEVVDSKPEESDSAIEELNLEESDSAVEELNLEENDSAVEELDLEESDLAIEELDLEDVLSDDEYSMLMEEDLLQAKAPPLSDQSISETEQNPKLYENKHKSRVLYKLGEKLPIHLWNKLIRRGVLFDNNIQFAEDDTWEIVDFCMKLYLNAETFGEANFPCYNSLINETFSKKIIDEDFGRLLLILSRWTGPAELVYPDYTAIIHQWMATIYLEGLLPRYGQLNKEDRKTYESAMSDFMWLLDIHQSQDNRIAKKLCNTFSMRMASNLLTAYHILCQKIKSIQNSPVA